MFGLWGTFGAQVVFCCVIYECCSVHSFSVFTQAELFQLIQLVIKLIDERIASWSHCWIENAMGLFKKLNNNSMNIPRSFLYSRLKFDKNVVRFNFSEHDGLEDSPSSVSWELSWARFQVFDFLSLHLIFFSRFHLYSLK